MELDLPFPEYLLLDDVTESDVVIGSKGRFISFEVDHRGFKCTGKRLLTRELDLHSKDESFREKIVREVVLHSQQRHPNIVQLLGVYCRPEPTLVTEYFPTNLSTWLENFNNIPEWIKSQILLDVVQGLTHLHNQKEPIVHFGLTSNNILLTQHSQAKIADLGTSRLFFNSKLSDSEYTYANSIFLPPELFSTDNTSYGTEVDVFSFGCVMVHVLSQQYPVPSDQHDFIEEENVTDQSLGQVSEWKRRSEYLIKLPSDHPLLPVAKKCLADLPHERPVTSNLVTDIKGTASVTFAKGGILELMEEKEKGAKEKIKLLETKVKDHISVLNAKESTNVRLNNLIQKKESRLKENEATLTASTEQVLQLEAQIATTLTQIKEYEESAALQTARILTLEREASSLNSLIVELEKIKDENSAQILHLTTAYEEQVEKSEALQSQLEIEVQSRDQKISTLEKQAGISNSVIVELDKIKEEKNAQIIQMTAALKKEVEKSDALHSQLEIEVQKKEELEKALAAETDKTEELQRQLAVTAEDQYRTQSIIYNQQAQLDSLQDCLNIANDTNDETKKMIKNLQSLQESLLDEQTNLSDKYQSDLAALSMVDDIDVIKQQAQALELKSALIQNEQLSKENASLKTALDDTTSQLKKQQNLARTLIEERDYHLAIVKSIIPIPLIQQKKTILSILKQQLVEGDSWYLVSSEWFHKWETYITAALKKGQDCCNDLHPGPVTNFMLMKHANFEFQPNNLREQLVQDVDYVLIPEVGWELLVEWYGISEKSCNILRKVTKLCHSAKTRLLVEIYPLTVNAMHGASLNEKAVSMQFSRTDSVLCVMDSLRKLYCVPLDVKTRLWLRHVDQWTLLKNTDTMGNNCSDCSVENGDTLVLDTNIDRVWTRSSENLPTASSRNPPEPSEKYYYITLPKSPNKRTSDYETMI